jgi:hypothetical protein
MVFGGEQRIEVGGGKLALLKQTIMQASLKMSVDGNPVADFSIAGDRSKPLRYRNSKLKILTKFYNRY